MVIKKIKYQDVRMHDEISINIEKRKSDRKLLFHYMKVMQAKSGLLAGYLADISTEGLMLLSSDTFETGKQFKFVIGLDHEIGKDAKLVFDARCIWCKKDSNPQYHVSGFKFIDMPTSSGDLINYLIQKYACGI